MNSRQSTRDKVLIGSTVEIRDLHSNDCETYTLAHPADANISVNRISSLAPLGKSLYGRRVGDIIAVDAPGGMFRVCIESIEHEPIHQLARAG